MAKKESTEVALQSWKPSTIDKIEVAVMQLSAITQVNNDTDLQKAELVIKTGKALFNAIQAERKGFTSRLDLIISEAMTFEKKVKAALLTPENLTTNYLRAKEQKRLEQERLIKEEADKKAAAIKKEADQKQALIDFELNTKKEIAGAKGLREINAIGKKLEGYIPSENTFGVNLKEALKIKKEMLKLVESQQKSLRDGGDKLEVDLESVEKKAEENTMNQMQKMQDVDLTAQAQTQSLGEVSGVKRNWTFEVTDINQVPREYLTLDEVKVKAMIKSGVRQIAGLNIFQDISRSGR